MRWTQWFWTPIPHTQLAQVCCPIRRERTRSPPRETSERPASYREAREPSRPAREPPKAPGFREPREPARATRKKDEVVPNFDSAIDNYVNSVKKLTRPKIHTIGTSSRFIHFRLSPNPRAPCAARISHQFCPRIFTPIGCDWFIVSYQPIKIIRSKNPPTKFMEYPGMQF